jgi:hypothetical protein
MTQTQVQVKGGVKVYSDLDNAPQKPRSLLEQFDELLRRAVENKLKEKAKELNPGSNIELTKDQFDEIAWAQAQVIATKAGIKNQDKFEHYKKSLVFWAMNYTKDGKDSAEKKGWHKKGEPPKTVLEAWAEDGIRRGKARIAKKKITASMDLTKSSKALPGTTNSK